MATVNSGQPIYSDILTEPYIRVCSKHVHCACPIPLMFLSSSFTIKKVFQALVSAAQEILTEADVGVALCGGAENMSQAPYILRNMRFGTKLGTDYAVRLFALRLQTLSILIRYASQLEFQFLHVLRRCLRTDRLRSVMLLYSLVHLCCFVTGKPSVMKLA